MADKRARPGESRNTHKERLTRPEYDHIRRTIAEALQTTGKSQRSLSLELGRSASFINKVLKGTRPLEYTEFIDVCLLLGLVPEEELKRSR